MAKRPLKESEVWAWLAEQLELPDIPPGLKEDALVVESFENYLKIGRGLANLENDARYAINKANQLVRQLQLLEGGDDEAFDPVLRRSRNTRGGYETPSSPDRTFDVPPPQLNEYEAARADAIASYMAILAAKRDAVRHFRRDVLDGVLLSQSEVDTFVTSPVLQRLSLRECRRQAIPVVGHRVTWVRSKPEDRQDAMRVDPPGTILRLSRLRSDEDSVTLDYPGPAPHHRPVWDVTIGSVVDQLRRCSEELTRLYGWDPVPAIRFVLTGAPPPSPPLRADMHLFMLGDIGRGEIRMRVAPWISEDTLRRTYRTIQRMYSKGKNAPAGVRNLRVFRFVTEQPTDDDGQRLPWRDLCTRWNAAHPAEDDHYPDIGNFSRDFYRAELIVRKPPYLSAYYSAFYAPAGEVPPWEDALPEITPEEAQDTEA